MTWYFITRASEPSSYSVVFVGFERTHWGLLQLPISKSALSKGDMCVRVPVDSILCGLNISPVEIYFDISIATNISKTKLSDIEAKLCLYVSTIKFSIQSTYWLIEKQMTYVGSVDLWGAITVLWAKCINLLGFRELQNGNHGSWWLKKARINYNRYEQQP